MSKKPQLTEEQRAMNHWFLQKLEERGYSQQEAEDMLAQDLADAAEEDGYDGA